MKSTGIVRKVDELGRIVIPKELRTTLSIEERDGLEIFVDQERVILKKYAPACLFCSSGDETVYFKGKLICHNCLTEMVEHQKEPAQTI